MTKLKITIGYPSPDRIDYRFYQDVLNLVFNNWLEYDIKLTNCPGSRIVMNRNQIVEEAKKAGSDYILWIDADTKFPASGLKRLLAHGKDVVCATTSRRIGNDRSPAAYPLDVNSIQPFQQLVPMRFVGLPFMLTKMSVFDKISEPYFAEPPRWMMDKVHGEDTVGYHYQDKDKDVMPEDEYFCWQLRRAGYDIMCDMELSMEIGHIGTTVYYIENPIAPGVTDGKIVFEENITDEAAHRAQGGIGE